MPPTAVQDRWLERVLGVTGLPPRSATLIARARPLAAAPAGHAGAAPEPPVRIDAAPRPKRLRFVPPPVLEPRHFALPDGGALAVAPVPGGGVVYTAPAAPLREITFSGGGAKGSALPGAVKALEASGALQTVRKVAGASVGSMTAALVAAGITADEFAAVANDDATMDDITEGTGGSKLKLLAASMRHLLGGDSAHPLTGKGLEDVVSHVLDQTLAKRIGEYLQGCAAEGSEPDAGVQAVALALRGRGPTFGDLRTLSASIPAIKEVVITGTYTRELATADIASQPDFRNRNDTGQLYVFDADSEPDMPVALAVHASASYPFAFKPVDIALSSGLTVRFIDGGVMNNTPTASSLGRQRELDPVPDSRAMVLIFEDKSGNSRKLLKGTAKAPAQGTHARLQDWVVGAELAATRFATSRSASERPDQLMEVPLTIEPRQMAWHQRQLWRPGKPTKDPDADMRGGTLNFGLPKQSKLLYQEKAEAATHAHIARSAQPVARGFASDALMLVSVPLGELRSLIAGGYAGAARALEMRERVGALLDQLQAAVQAAHGGGEGLASLPGRQDIRAAFDELETLNDWDVDYQGHIAREINKRGDLDALFDAARKQGLKGATFSAAYAVADAVKAHDHARNILSQVLYPKMKQEARGGAGIATLLAVEALLRKAQRPADVNGALQIAIDHFRDKPDHRVPRRGHRAFARQLEERLMP